MQCSKCNNEMKYYEGVSKKTGKPYKMHKCQACNHIEWVRDDQPYGVAQNNTANVPAKASGEVLAELKEIKKLLAEIATKVTGRQQYTQEDLQPDNSNVPF